ncbi:MAG: thioredoxin fold domain-containing protein [Ectothiorhodospiraceae bacterium]|jgi:thioredoxin-related protein|nr:thioredoxin fold domain-containing protein [Ectothiorhodospiraceae bacterium]
MAALIHRSLYLVVLCPMLLLGVAAAQDHSRPEGRLAEGMVNPGWHEPPSWFKESFLDIREDIREATAEGRRLLLYFYQDGCPYCKKLLTDNFGQHAIAEKTRRHFDTIAINLWGDREVTDLQGRHTTEKDFARDLRVQFTPTLLMLDERGEVVLRLNGYVPPHHFEVALDYVGLHKEREISAKDFLARADPRPATGMLHVKPQFVQPPWRLAELIERGDRPLLVSFEQQQCAACDELHLDILDRAESRELLERFHVVLLDMWSNDQIQTPDGRELSVSDWARSLGVHYAPSMLFFDRTGREVFRTEGFLRAFHVQSALDYVASGAWREQPEFQRYIEHRADRMRAIGVELDLMD